MLKTKDMMQLSTISSSKGNQRKWLTIDGCYVKEQFFYQGKYWRDDLVEIIASSLGQQLGYNVVEQCGVEIEDNSGKITHGVISDNFCYDGYQFVSLKRLFSLNNYEFDLTLSANKRFVEMMSKVYEFAGIDITQYLIQIVIIDYLVGNEDRHLNNLGVLYNSKYNRFEPAPIFDCGLGLFEHDDRYTGVRFSKCLDMMTCKPFSANNQIITDWVIDTFNVRFPKNLSLSGCEIPSPKAGSYLLNRCIKLGIELGGVY